MATHRETIVALPRGPTLDGLIARFGKGRTLPELWRYAKELVLFRMTTLGFDLVLLVIMTGSLVAAALALGGRIRLFQATALLPLATTCAAVVIRARRNPAEWKSEFGRTLRDWVPFLLIVFIYENLHDVAGQVTDIDIAGALLRWDVAIFGVEPSLWAQRFFSPLATDLWSISYALYFIEPLLLMFLLSIAGRRRDFRYMALSLTITFFLGFLGYIFLPASPPRYFIEHLFTDPPRLSGCFLFNQLQGAWDNLSVVSGGAFPSLHVGLSTAALIFAHRFRNDGRLFRGLWWLYVPLVTSLWVSTITLRHHWAIDIFAGWAVAVVGVVGSDILMRAWKRLSGRYGIPF